MDMTTESNIFYREEASKRRKYDALIERVFRPEDQQKDRNVSKVDIEVLEKEISIGKKRSMP